MYPIEVAIDCTLYSMTWLKKKLHKMGLFRRGTHVNYTPISLIKVAVQVFS